MRMCRLLTRPIPKWLNGSMTIARASDAHSNECVSSTFLYLISRLTYFFFAFDSDHPTCKVPSLSCCLPYSSLPGPDSVAKLLLVFWLLTCGAHQKSQHQEFYSPVSKVIFGLFAVEVFTPHTLHSRCFLSVTLLILSLGSWGEALMWGCVVVSKGGRCWWEDLQLFEESSSALAIVLEGGASGAFSRLGAAFLNSVSLWEGERGNWSASK